AFVGSAYANFGPHGGYVNDTDACAGCHRAHTSFSTVGWRDGLGTNHASALLVGNAATMTQFCDACHGDQAPGASTNVVSGVFDSGPSGGTGVLVGATTAVNGAQAAGYPGDIAPGVTVQYTTNSTFNAPLNGGGFTRMPDPYVWQGTANGGTGAGGAVVFVALTSAHHMDVAGPLWGSGSAVTSFGGTPGMTCTDCHDPHGSSNYRLLKAKPNPVGPVVGGYAPDGETPNAFVFSDEEGYPVPTSVTFPGQGVYNGSYPFGGWLKHQAGADQMALYKPNYTDTAGTPILHSPQLPDPITHAPRDVSMSIWCSACHTNYNQSSAGNATTYNYKGFLPGDGAAAGSNATAYTAAGLGNQAYHRHAIDVNMAAGFSASRALVEQVVSAPQWVPLENSGITDPTQFENNYIGCLTCHRAHGASVAMTGWAAAHLELGTGPNAAIYQPVKDGITGVSPDKGVWGASMNQGTSALLRADNRGVCERCHNK
ncbi:MAG: cytochrome c3 family protein, partial [Actinomycetes bacterium]